MVVDIATRRCKSWAFRHLHVLESQCHSTRSSGEIRTGFALSPILSTFRKNIANDDGKIATHESIFLESAGPSGKSTVDETTSTITKADGNIATHGSISTAKSAGSQNRSYGRLKIGVVQYGQYGTPNGNNRFIGSSWLDRNAVS